MKIMKILPQKRHAIRMFIHRGRHGWAPRDTWSFDLYLARVMSEGIAWLAEHDHGYPAHDPWDTPEKWQDYLRDLSARLGTWNDDTFLDNEAYEVTAAAVREAGSSEVFGYLWD